MVKRIVVGSTSEPKGSSRWPGGHRWNDLATFVELEVGSKYRKWLSEQKNSHDEWTRRQPPRGPDHASSSSKWGPYR